ncbi:lyase family protein [Modicisalibacter luteus]
MAEPAARVLVPAVGSDTAKRIAREASETARVQGRPYADVLLEHTDVAGKVDEAALRDAVRPELYIGSSHAQVERVLNALK